MVKQSRWKEQGEEERKGGGGGEGKRPSECEALQSRQVRGCNCERFCEC